jgi:hypothetical protein
MARIGSPAHPQTSKFHLLGGGASQGTAEKEDAGIKSRIATYYRAGQDNRIKSALNMYTSFRRPAIRRNRIQAIAKDTEY